MQNQDKYNTANVKNILSENHITLLDNYTDAKTKMLCLDNDGYYIYIVLSNFLTRHGIGRRFDKSNDHTIDNINKYLFDNNILFKCISNCYLSANNILEFQCVRCGKIITSPWRNVNKNDKFNRNHLICNNCDGRNESLHASILKQMFLHYYPDTTIEDKTYINPKTQKICPTDIVNHRLKIAIEIQSQWHDYPDIQEKDKRKKNFWISLGYEFYDPDIRDYSILEMCQLFFNIDEIPEWINYEYSNKINVKQIQLLLNEGNSVCEIAKELSINPHRIYDAIYSKKIFYPSNYKYVNNIKSEYKTQESSETAGCA